MEILDGGKVNECGRWKGDFHSHTPLENVRISPEMCFPNQSKHIRRRAEKNMANTILKSE